MNLDEFRARVVALYDDCLAAAGSPTPVHDACTRLLPLIAADARQRELQYRVLRDVVDGAARAEDPRPYLLLVAVHDSLLRDGALLSPQPAIAQLCYFDEAHYLHLHPDVAVAVRAGTYSDGFEHFVRCGALEGRTAHAWRPALRLAPPLPERSAVDAVGSAGGGRWTGPRPDGHPTNGTAHLAQREGPTAGEDLGVNLIGFHSANLGLGVSARHYYRFLVESGFD